MRIPAHSEEAITRALEASAVHRESLKLRPRLAYLFFEVTTRCNLRCLHCGSSCTEHGANADMPADYVSTVLDSVERNRKENDPLPLLCVTGGEPLLYPRLTDVMSAASRRGFAWGMTTNATLVDDDVARALYGAGLATVTVSVDGLEESHDWFRNAPGAFARMERGLGALVRHAPSSARVDVITVVHRRNISELPELYRRLEGTGIRSWRITNMEPIGRAREHSELMLDGGDLARLLDFVREAHLTSPSLEVSFGCSHYLTPEYERRARPYCFICMAGLQVASIAANGDIVACLDIERRPDLAQGNVARDDFWDVWQGKFGLFRGNRAESSPTCSACPDRRFCAGDSAHTWNYDYNEPMLCMKHALEEKRGAAPWD